MSESAKKTISSDILDADDAAAAGESGIGQSDFRHVGTDETAILEADADYHPHY